MTGKKQLSGNSMGRAVLSECLVHEYEMNGAKEWDRMVRKRLEKDVFLDDIIQSGKEVAGKRKQRDDGEKESKKKRKGTEMGVDSIMQAIQIPGK